jgi:hypothetical protein
MGFSAAGPSATLSLTFEVFPFTWFAFDGGVMPLAPGLVGAWIGARARGPRIGPLTPFVGGFAHASFLGGDTSDDPEAEKHRGVAAIGPRFGLEFAFPIERHALVAEFDLVRPAEDRFLYRLHGRLIPWAGIGYLHRY